MTGAAEQEPDIPGTFIAPEEFGNSALDVRHPAFQGSHIVKRFVPAVFGLLLFVGACASSQTPPVPVPPAASPAPTPAPLPSDPIVLTSPDEAPENWWLLDPALDGIPGISAERAYRELLANREPRRTVVVAIIDSGVDIQHEDLDDVLWVNEREVAGNGVDDDGNGYVDDIHGWSFLGAPDGRNIEYDTFEVTRLYRDCRDRGELSTPACQAITADFEAERFEAESFLQQYSSIASTQAAVVEFLESHLGADSLTREAVTNIQSSDPQVQQARQIYLQLLDAGATPEVIAEGIEYLTVQVQYHFNPDFDPRPLIGDDPNDPNDRDYGNNDVEGPGPDHGTLVAGIVGAERGNNVGVDGVADAVEFMVVRAVPNGDERDKDVANAIRYAVDNGADIINMSFGKSYSPGKAWVDDAVRHAMENEVLMVHAAGNDAADLDDANNFPNPYYEGGGEADLWIQVGASGWTATGLAAPFSNYGRAMVDVFAPGIEIRSSAPNDEYEATQGTSMAAPVVSGVAALLMAYYPELTPAQVREIILETAVTFPGQAVVIPGGVQQRGFDELSVTGGIVNAYAALRRAAEVVGR